MYSETSWFERLLVLRTMPGFRELESNALAPWAAHTREVRFAAGDVIQSEDEATTHVYLFNQGSIRMTLGGQTYRILRENGTIGTIAAFARLENGHGAIAIEDTVALELEFETMLDLFEDNFMIFRRVLKAFVSTALDARKAMGTTAGFTNEIAEQPDPIPELDLVGRLWTLKQTLAFTIVRWMPSRKSRPTQNLFTTKRGRDLGTR